MKREKLVRLPKEEIIQLFEILRLDQRTIDGLWFLAVEDTYGLKRAVELDAAIWSKMGRINAQRLQKAFDLKADGIQTLVKAIELDPLWLFFGYEVEYLSNTEAVVRFTDCPAQKGRLKIGRAIFPCRSVDENYFESFAKAIEPRVKVRCNFCPPEKYSDNLWCEWHFSLIEGV